MLLTDEQQKQIVATIKAAEKNTSGEVKVHIEANCTSDEVLDRAKEVFFNLGMHRTERRNGVLFYVATEDRKFAILGDEGIDAVVPDDFWQTTRDLMRKHFQKAEYAEGLSAGIQLAGQQLQAYFPYQDDDTNELSDDISFG
ncbi:MAG: TPM domain-containing protein [Spirosomataceae bacterium]